MALKVVVAMTTPTRDFLLEDYRLKAQYLTDQFSRMWNRFQFLLTIETAVAGLYFAPLGDKRIVSAPAFAIIGITVSLFWYTVGAQDRAYVVWYRMQLENAAKKVAPAFGLDQYSYVGDETGFGSAHDLPVLGSFKVHFVSPLEWRVDRISVTHLAAAFPLLVLVFWIVMLSLPGNH
jgi:hypothetical protein